MKSPEKANHFVINRRTIFIGMVLAIAIVAYYLPWLSHPTAGLSPNARDLAEWASLLPAARNSTPPLLPSFFLRLTAALWAGTLAVYGIQYWAKNKLFGWLGVMAGALLALTLLPPLEFFTTMRSDLNYQQQFSLFLLTTAIILGSAWLLNRWQSALLHHGLRIALLSTTVVTAVIGVSEGQRLLSAFEVGQSIGIGAPLFVGAATVLLIDTIWQYSKQRG